MMSPLFNPWRSRLRALLDEVPAVRSPALRRSPRPDALLATDLPLCAAPEVCQAFLEAAGQAGWICAAAESWLHFRPADFCLQPDWLALLPAEGEAGALGSLLSRHPELTLSAEQALALIKAGEEGPVSLEKCCRGLHQALACQLRQRGEARIASARAASAP